MALSNEELADLELLRAIAHTGTVLTPPKSGQLKTRRTSNDGSPGSP